MVYLWTGDNRLIINGGLNCGVVVVVVAAAAAAAAAAVLHGSGRVPHQLHQGFLVITWTTEVNVLELRLIKRK